MLCRVRRARPRREGATVVETAVVLTVFLMLLFGIFEYCRFLMVLHVADNAARDGARYAAVRTNTAPDQADTVRQEVIDYATSRMGGVQRNIDGFRVAVFAVDPAGLDLSPQVVRPKTRSTASPPVYPDPFNLNDPNAYPWNSSGFPDRVGVTVNGTYRPLLPAFLLMPSAIPINVTAHAASEG